MQASTPASAPDLAAIQEVIDAHTHLEGPLLPILHGMMEAFDHVPEDAVQPIADTLNIGRAEVHGVISFYHDFRTLPAGRHIVKICRAEACQALGANRLADAVLAKLGTGWHGTTPNGAVTIEPVYCLGLCANGPAAMIDDKVVGALDVAKLEKVIAEAGA
ncbi:formate dehydrogenase subunit gamma [Maritimibacter sp. UBA3975]|uniref:formate dehydrogenase subunit gamma n=1 Tax=Maritimibacter sp. UBA3975 TaxID=1946833 RepID=UPI000C0A9467|nr:formate dehydrogenase subunit gamma [Maritimibacter sp. UBA3975]MAM62635.1 formate dehydrogenase subunit gamma [Maritimibacter sp.]|tara:strand:+ start:16880 stop:17362 length:483 start_codon:yes stop_codon:yes gene_type:complete